MHYKSGILWIASRIICIAGALLAWQTTAVADTVTTDITRSGRKIMHDGFLMEWSIQSAQTWGKDTAWLWDAAATPEGLAGYLRTQSAAACSGWVVGFSGPSLDRSFEVRLPADSTWQSDFVKIGRVGDNSSGAYALEWLFPWPQGQMGIINPLSLTIQGWCITGDTLPVMVLRGIRPEKKNDVWKNLAGRVVLIGILALMYLMVYRKIKHQAQHRGDPHSKT